MWHQFSITFDQTMVRQLCDPKRLRIYLLFLFGFRVRLREELAGSLDSLGELPELPVLPLFWF
jgi:hypothetical protein